MTSFNPTSYEELRSELLGCEAEKWTEMDLVWLDDISSDIWKVYEENKKLKGDNEAIIKGSQATIMENKKLKEELEVTSVTLDMVKDENEVNKKNLRLCFNTDDKDKADALAGRTPGLTDPKVALERVRMEKHVLRQTACHELYNLQESIHNIINSLP